MPNPPVWVASLRFALLVLLPLLSAGGAEPQPEACIRALVGGAAGPPSYEHALAILHDLVRVGDPAVGPALDALRSSDPALRAHAAFALGRLRAPRALGPLLTALADPVPDVRAAAAEALGRLGDPRAVEPLLASLGRDHELDQRSAAVALGELRAPAALAPLQALLAAPNWEVRWRAAVALGKLGDAAAAPALGALANDRDAVTAAAASWARAAVLGNPVPGGLALNLTSPDAGVVRASAWALGVIGDGPAIAALTAGLKRQGTAPEACGLVLLWLGPSAPAAATADGTTPRPPRPLADIAERWLDRYGDLAITVSEPFVISHREAQPERGAHSRPRLFRLPKALLLCFDRLDGDDGAAGPTTVLRSRDGGQTWQDLALPLNRLEAAAVDGAAVRLWDGLAFESTAGTYTFQSCFSEDGGQGFGALSLARLERPGAAALRTLGALRLQPYLDNAAKTSRRYSPGLRGGVVAVPDGGLLAVAETRAPGDEQTRCVSYRSADHGGSWAGETTIGGDGHAEPAVAMLPGGRAVAMLRELTAGSLVLSWSTDGGTTWVGPVRSGSVGTAPSLCVTGAGVLVCSYTQDGPRLMFTVAADARRWTDRIRPTAAAPGAARGHTSLVETEPGRLLLVYDALGRAADPTGQTAAIMGCEITVQRSAP